MRDQARCFVAGVILGGLIVLIAIAFIACNVTAPRISSTWSIITPGTTAIETSCGVIVIQVHTNTDRSVYFWRIAIIPKVKPVKPKPPKVPPST